MDEKQLPNSIFSSLNANFNPMNLIVYLKQNEVWYRIMEKSATVHTAEAASKTGLPLERVTKSLVFLADDLPILAIIPGNCRVNKSKLKETLGVKGVEIVPFEQVERYSGYPPGATPPVCHKKIKRVVIDKKVMQHATVFGGGGSRRKLIELKPEDIQRLNNALVADIAEVKR